MCESDFGDDYVLGSEDGQFSVALKRDSGKLHAVAIKVVVTDSNGLRDEVITDVKVTGEARVIHATRGWDVHLVPPSNWVHLARCT